MTLTPIVPPATTFTPATPDYAERVRASFVKQGVMTTIGAELAAVAPGYCAITLSPRPEVSQQHGYVHAGIVATIVDSAAGYAGFTLFPADATVLSVEFKINLLAPSAGDRLIAEGFVVKPGRNLTIARGEVHAEKDGRRTLTAILQQTLMVMRDRPEK